MYYRPDHYELDPKTETIFIGNNNLVPLLGKNTFAIDASAGGDKADFDMYYEKVVDTSLKFAPTATECAVIAIAPKTTQFEAGTCIVVSDIAVGMDTAGMVQI